MRQGDGTLVVVKGGAGIIGSHLTEALLSHGYTVRGIDNLATGRLENLSHCDGEFEWVEGDVADFEVSQRAVAGATAVLHQAAIPSVPRSVKQPLESHTSGPTATLNVLEAARRAGVKRV